MSFFKGMSRSIWQGSQYSEAAKYLQAQARSMYIQTQTTPNPSSIKFVPGQPVTASHPSLRPTFEFNDARSTFTVSPLASQLFKIDGVKQVMLGPDFITVSKVDDLPWSVIKPEVFATLMDHFQASRPIFHPSQTSSGDGSSSATAAATDTTILESDSEAVATIKELLESRIRPSIMEDGGDIEYKGFDEETGIVSLTLKGSCRGCASSEITLKGGIERMLKHYVPEVTSVEQVGHSPRR